VKQVVAPEMISRCFTQCIRHFHCLTHVLPGIGHHAAQVISKRQHPPTNLSCVKYQKGEGLKFTWTEARNFSFHSCFSSERTDLAVTGS